MLSKNNVNLILLLAATFICVNALPITPANAAIVNFSGTVVDSCVLTLNSPGVLATSTGGTRLASDEAGGAPAVLSVVATGTAPTIAFTAPSLASAPGDLSGTPVVSISYTSLRGANQGYTSSASGYTLTGGLLDTVNINARADNSAGFTQGSYTVSTVATCEQ